jgi:hypothetical protein
VTDWQTAARNAISATPISVSAFNVAPFPSHCTHGHLRRGIRRNPTTEPGGQEPSNGNRR